MNALYSEARLVLRCPPWVHGQAQKDCLDRVMNEEPGWSFSTVDPRDYDAAQDAPEMPGDFVLKARGTHDELLAALKSTAAIPSEHGLMVVRYTVAATTVDSKAEDSLRLVT